MSYVTTNDVYRTSGLTSSVVGTSDVQSYIDAAEVEICRLTRNIYYKRELDNQLATSGTNNTIVVSTASWTTNAYANMFVWVYSGTGSGQFRKILSNTGTALTVDENWSTNPDSTSYFRVFYVPSDFNPKVTDNYDGNDMIYFYLPYYPVQDVESLSVEGTSVTVDTYLYLWKKTGRIQFKSGAEVSKFSSGTPQAISVEYWYGVDYLPQEIKRLVELNASMKVLGQQTGGTYDDPSTVGLPEMNLTIGQAYINIRGALDMLQAEYNTLLSRVKIYPVFG